MIDEKAILVRMEVQRSFFAVESARQSLIRMAGGARLQEATYPCA